MFLVSSSYKHCDTTGLEMLDSAFVQPRRRRRAGLIIRPKCACAQVLLTTFCHKFSAFLKSDLKFLHEFYPKKRMAGLLTLFLHLIKEELGVTAIEYALIAALIAIAAISAFSLVGTNLSSTFSYVASQL
jgi:pilus assembly protein Flp/PilA